MAEKKVHCDGGYTAVVQEISAIVGGYQLSETLFPGAVNYRMGTVNLDMIRAAFAKHYYGLNVANRDIVLKALILLEDGSFTVEEFQQVIRQRKVGTKKVLRNKVKEKRRKNK